MGFKCGIVGMPNVGKSTLFNALTKAGIDAENFPFCTIDPNTGIVAVPDARLDKLAALVDHDSVTYAAIEFVDIAGLVRGASKGEGLGNQFLGHIRDVTALVHVVRCFDDDNVIHVQAKPEPRADIEVVAYEMMMADLQQLENKREKMVRQVKGDKKLIPVMALAEELQALLEAIDFHFPVANAPVTGTTIVEAFVGRQILRCLRLSVFGQKRGRGADKVVDSGQSAHCEVGIPQFADLNTNVEFGINREGYEIGANDVECDVRVLARKRRQFRHDPAITERRRHANLQGSRRPGPRPCDLLFGMVQIFNNSLAAFIKLGAFFCHHQTPSRAINQTRRKPFLQSGEGGADRRCRYAQDPCRCA